MLSEDDDGTETTIREPEKELEGVNASALAKRIVRRRRVIQVFIVLFTYLYIFYCYDNDRWDLWSDWMMTCTHQCIPVCWLIYYSWYVVPTCRWILCKYMLVCGHDWKIGNSLWMTRCQCGYMYETPDTTSFRSACHFSLYSCVLYYSVRRIGTGRLR